MRQLFEERVAVFVPEGVVDVLELVEVDHQQCDGRAGLGAVVERTGQALVHERSVRQTGEHVVGCLVAERFCGSCPLGHVLQGDADAAVGEGYRPQGEDLIDAADLHEWSVVWHAGADDDGHVVEELVGDGQQVARSVSDRSLVERHDRARCGVRCEQHQAGRVVGVGHPHHEQRNRDPLDEVGVSPQRRLGLPPCGFVDQDASAADHLAGAVGHDLDPVLQATKSAPRVGDPEVHLDVLAVSDQPLAFEDHGQVVGVDAAVEEAGVAQLLMRQAEQVDHVVAQEVGRPAGPGAFPHGCIDAVDQFVVAVALCGQRRGDVAVDDRREGRGDDPRDEVRLPGLHVAAHADREQGDARDGHEPADEADAEPKHVQPGTRGQHDDDYSVRRRHGGGDAAGDGDVSDRQHVRRCRTAADAPGQHQVGCTAEEQDRGADLQPMGPEEREQHHRGTHDDRGHRPPAEDLHLILAADLILGRARSDGCARRRSCRSPPDRRRSAVLAVVVLVAAHGLVPFPARRCRRVLPRRPQRATGLTARCPSSR